MNKHDNFCGTAGANCDCPPSFDPSIQESTEREMFDDPIGTDCPCELGSDKHYHPDCRDTSKDCVPCLKFHASEHKIFGTASYSVREPYKFIVGENGLSDWYKIELKGKGNEYILISKGLPLLTFRINRAKKKLIRRREFLEGLTQ